MGSMTTVPAFIEARRSIRAFTPQALERLKSHAWPGNVRELENRVKQAMVMAKGDVIDVESLDLFPGGTVGTSFPSFKKAKAEFEIERQNLERTRRELESRINLRDWFWLGIVLALIFGGGIAVGWHIPR